MSIQSEITRINTNIANAYSAVTAMGGTVPQTQNSANLPDAIATLYEAQYIQLEWIESTGTQWINTGLNCTTIGKIQTSYNFSSLNSDWKAVMLGETVGNNDYPGLGILAKSSQHKFEYGTYNSSYTQSSVSANTVYTVDLDGINNQITINNTTYNTSFDRTLPNTNLTLFVTDGDTGGYYYGSGVRMYYCKLYNLSGELVRDFIPVMRKSDYEVGLYDKVSKTFFGNSGTGSFRPGIKIAGYNILDYIQGTGTQYIDTGITPTNSYQIEMTASSFNVNDRPFFGAYNTWASPSFMVTRYNSLIYYYGYPSGGSAYSISFNATTDTPYTITVSSSKFTVNNTTVSTSTLGPINTTLKLFWGGSRIGSFKLYSTKVYNGNTLVGNYIPVQRVSDSHYGLYDLVTNTFYGNNGTGTFTAGSVTISNDGTNSPYYSIPVVVPSPSSYSGSIANQILRIEENIENAYNVCAQIGRAMPFEMNSENLRPTILDAFSNQFPAYSYTGSGISTRDITSNGKTYKVLTITGSGTLSFSKPVMGDIWICGGGASGSPAQDNHPGAGGGAGSANSSYDNIFQNISITIGRANNASGTIISGDISLSAAGAIGKNGSSGGGGALFNIHKEGNTIYYSSIAPGTGDGLNNKLPFNDSANFTPTGTYNKYCAGGGGGGFEGYRSGTWYARGGNGGSAGSDGGSGNMIGIGGGGGSSGGGEGGDTMYSDAECRGSNAQTYGSGGGGGAYHYTSGNLIYRGAGGNGKQGVCFIRIRIA